MSSVSCYFLLKDGILLHRPGLLQCFLLVTIVCLTLFIQPWVCRCMKQTHKSGTSGLGHYPDFTTTRGKTTLHITMEYRSVRPTSEAAENPTLLSCQKVASYFKTKLKLSLCIHVYVLVCVPTAHAEATGQC